MGAYEKVSSAIETNGVSFSLRSGHDAPFFYQHCICFLRHRIFMYILPLSLCVCVCVCDTLVWDLHDVSVYMFGMVLKNDMFIYMYFPSCIHLM
jgi:hypothetical protein